jgi:16S rRNA (guanine527-N7)-methyltransferase
MESILSYFPNLTDLQKQQFEALMPLYTDWNAKINVISRKDMDNLYLHHVLHSLAIAKYVPFRDGAAILDLGTGGGFPGIPLAILYPNVKFVLTDSIAKKIKVVQEVSTALELKNVTALAVRSEEVKEKFDFVVTRAVATYDKLALWSLKSLKRKQQHGIPNGIIALKGGNVREEFKLITGKPYFELIPIQTWFKEAYFEEKFVAYLQG